MINDLLLEVGIENFPSELTGLVKRVLDEEFSKTLYFNHIHFDKITVESTKKRFVLIVRNLQVGDTEIEDLLSFFKESIPKIIANVTIPIYNEVDSRKCHFIHYITWIQCVFHDKLIHFDQTDDIYENKSNEKEYFQIDSIQDYRKTLENNSILLELEERKNQLSIKANKLVREHGDNLYRPKKLIDFYSNIYDYPEPHIGRFDSNYLVLQDELIHTILRNEFQVISVIDDNNSCSDYFVAIEEYQSNIDIDRYAQNINTRLEEVKNLLLEDLDRPLEAYVEELDNIPYIQFGSYKDKTKRLETYSKIIAEKLAVGKETIANTARLATLSKADLATNVVKEIPILKGTIGMIYALEQGEREIIAKGICEHYQPTFSNEELPATTSAKIVAFVDKLDEIITLYAMKEQGQDFDPLLVRRDALGIIDIVLGSKWILDMENTIQDGLFTLLKHSDIPINYKKILRPLINIIKINFKDSLIRKGHKFYIIDGIMEDADLDLYDLYSRVKAMSAITERSNHNFLRFIILLNEYEKRFFEEEREYTSCERIEEWEEMYDKNQYNDLFESVDQFRQEHKAIIKTILGQDQDKHINYDDILIPLNRIIRSIYNIDAVFIPD